MTEPLSQLEELAADYVTGTLDSEARARVEARMAHDPRLARLVRDWTLRLAPIAESIPPVAPPARIWQSIAAAIQLREDQASKKTPWPRRLSFWRGFSAVSLAFSAALAIALVVVLTPVTENRFVALLGEDPDRPSWLVSIDLETRKLTIRPVGELAQPKRDYQLWLVVDQAPHSLGILDPSHALAMPLSLELDEEGWRKASLAVSLEPEGGSPTGLPTGPVVFHGPVRALD